MRRVHRGGSEIGRGGQGVIETMDELPARVGGAYEVEIVYVDLRTGEERRRSVQTRLLSSMVPGAVFKLALEKDRARGRMRRGRERGGRVGGGVADENSSANVVVVASPPQLPVENARAPQNARQNARAPQNAPQNAPHNARQSAKGPQSAPMPMPLPFARSPNSPPPPPYSPPKEEPMPMPMPMPLPFARSPSSPPTPYSPPKEELRPRRRYDPMREEFEGNLTLARSLATGNLGRRKHIRVLTVNTPFIVREDRFLVIGVVARASKMKNEYGIGFDLDHDDHDHDHVEDEEDEYFPMYRRMGGNLTDFSKRFPRDVTLHLALEATKACLDVLEVLLSAGAHHCDVKEENMLYDIKCSRRTSPRGKRRSYPPPCRVEFSVSDFGLVSINPTRVSNRGTAGSICPLTYAHDDKGKSAYETDHILSSRVATAAQLWESYEHDRNLKTKRSTDPRLVHEKADLFAVGVMLALFARLDADPPPAESDGRSRAFDFVTRLLRGDRGSIWTIERAQKSISKLLRDA